MSSNFYFFTRQIRNLDVENCKKKKKIKLKIKLHYYKNISYLVTGSCKKTLFQCSLSVVGQLLLCLKTSMGGLQLIQNAELLEQKEKLIQFQS